RHEVDLLVQARLRAEPSFFLIHVETQASKQQRFAKRMFKYFARLLEKHDAPIYPVALFTYDAPRRLEQDSFEVAIAGREILHFRFVAIQLNRLSWKDFKDVDNPVASALMVKMGVAQQDRSRVKLECFRMLVRLKLDPARLQLIIEFINAYLRLDPAEKEQFQVEVQAVTPEEREVIMELTNEWIEQGRQEGRQEGEATVLLRLLTKRLGSLTPQQQAAILALPTPELENLAEALFEISSPAELDARLP
ncbi:MAG: Rpn family recombination-promoting nuclease/putative transposase, partial [Candidatus Sericytochromatia bacterium]